jgi:hypothetical protein
VRVEGVCKIKLVAIPEAPYNVVVSNMLDWATGVPCGGDVEEIVSIACKIVKIASAVRACLAKGEIRLLTQRPSKMNLEVITKSLFAMYACCYYCVSGAVSNTKPNQPMSVSSRLSLCRLELNQMSQMGWAGAQNKSVFIRTCTCRINSKTCSYVEFERFYNLIIVGGK